MNPEYELISQSSETDLDIEDTKLSCHEIVIPKKIYHVMFSRACNQNAVKEIVYHGGLLYMKGMTDSYQIYFIPVQNNLPIAYNENMTFPICTCLSYQYENSPYYGSCKHIKKVFDDNHVKVDMSRRLQYEEYYKLVECIRLE